MTEFQTRVKRLLPIGMICFLVIVGFASVFLSSVNAANLCSQLSFSDSQHPEERHAVHQLLKKKIEEAESLPATDKVDIEIAVTDLNDDGIGDILAHIHHPYFCGLHGCTLLIFVVEDKRWNKVLDVTTDEPVMLSSKRTNGFHDLVLQGESEWKWNGKMYEFHRRGERACFSDLGE